MKTKTTIYGNNKIKSFCKDMDTAKVILQFAIEREGQNLPRPIKKVVK